MKKQFEITNVETVAFDDHIVTLKSADSTVKLHLHDQTEFDAFDRSSVGKTVAITFEAPTKSAKKSTAKTPAKKAKAKKKKVSEETGTV